MAQTTSILKKKKKKWISIAASREFNNTELGETFVEETENVVGKVVCANMMNLVRDAKKQNIQLYFIVTHVKDNIANTELYGYEMVNAFIKRFSKKAKERIDNSFGCVSKDNVQFKIKPILMTKGVAHKSVAISLRKKSEELIRSYAKQITFAEIMKSVIMGNMQKDLKTELKKIYPLNSCMIKSMKKISK
jgi:small subunit ribosomal protein S3Ae